MANAGTYHRTFRFGQNGSMWSINGQTWDSGRVAASDVGQNSWEVWRYVAGSGMAHPVHVHLVDQVSRMTKDKTMMFGRYVCSCPRLAGSSVSPLFRFTLILSNNSNFCSCLFSPFHLPLTLNSHFYRLFCGEMLPPQHQQYLQRSTEMFWQNTSNTLSKT